MKTAKLFLALAIAVDATAAFAAPAKRDTPIGADNAAIGKATHRWYQAGPRELQQERLLLMLDRQGFLQFAN